MDYTTIVVPSSSASSIDSNDGPIEVSSDADNGGGRNTNRGGGSGVRNTNRGGRNTNAKKRTASSVVSNHGPVELLPSDDDDDTVLDETTRKKLVAADRKRLRMEPIYTCWEFCDERIMLKELAAARRETGRRPSAAELFRILEDKGFLKRRNVTTEVIRSKMYNLKTKFVKALNNGGPGKKSSDRKIYDLSKEVWTLEELRKEGKLI